MRRRVLPLVLAAVLPSGALAQSADLLLNCSSCHALTPEAVPSLYPSLNGQPARYLERQLDAYRMGLRRHPQMQQSAIALGEGAGAMARMYADAPVPQLEQHAELPPAAIALVEEGDWSRGLPSCASCHGMAEAGEMRVAPRLHGQPAGYLARQLRAYADGTRQSGPMGRMRAYSERLSSQEITALADYYAAWRPARATQEDRPDG